MTNDTQKSKQTAPTLVKDVMWTQVDIVDSKCTVHNALSDMQHKKN